MTGSWYSICWQPKDFNDPNSFIELDGCPRFYFSKDGAPPSKTDLESRFPHLFVKEIFKTAVYTENDQNQKMPTHYRYGVFMPGDNSAYDSWLTKSFELNSFILEKVKVEEELLQKNVFLEYASKLIRHDMHSGINTYIPRGLQGLIKKLPEKVIREYKLNLQIKLLEEGLSHTKKVYDRVKNFTDLVKEESQLKKEIFDLKKELEEYFSKMPTSSFIEIENLAEVNGNKVLICSAIENFVVNGLNYNKSKDKLVKIYMKDSKTISIEDNGIGMTVDEFEGYRKPYHGIETSGLGFGINISSSILIMHGFKFYCEEKEGGTIINISIG
jgi:signal transduction histidine kinase